MNVTDVNNAFYKSVPWSLKARYNLRFTSEHFLGFPFLQSYFERAKNGIDRRLLDQLSGLDEQLLKVPELAIDLDPSTIQKDYIKKGLPFVIRNGAKNWDAYKNWDFDFFKKEYGNHPVILTNHKELGDSGDHVEQSNLANIIDGLEHDSMKYARFNPLLDVYPELQNELNQFWLRKVRDTDLKKHHVLFIGNKGTKTNIHNAGNENIFVHIRGSKKWILWDQRAYFFLNPTVNRAPAKSSTFNPESKEIDLPLFKIPRYETICHPGDIIYIPSYLWHYVRNTTPTIGVGIRWLSPFQSIKNCPMFAFLELFNTSPSIFHTMNWKNGFDFNKIMVKNLEKKK